MVQRKEVASRRVVFNGKGKKNENGKVYVTSGGLEYGDLFQDKYGNIKSKAASKAAKKNKNLGKHQLEKGSKKFVPGGKKK